MSRVEQLLIGLGKTSYKEEVISSATLALMAFFYAYVISSFSRLPVFVLKDRVVYDRPFGEYVFGNYADNIIISVGLLIWLWTSLRRTKLRNISCIIYAVLLLASVVVEPSLLQIFSLVSLPLILTLIIYQRVVLKHRKKEFIIANGSLFLAYFSLIFIVISIVSITSSLQPVISSDFNDVSSRNYLHDVYVMLSPAAAALMVIIVFSFPLKLIVSEILAIFPKLRSFPNRKPSAVPDLAYSEAQKSESKYNIKHPTVNGQRTHDKNVLIVRKITPRRRNSILILLPILALSSILALIPYQPALNIDDRLVGVDTGYQYTRWLNNIINSSDQGPSEIARQIITEQGVNGDRPLSLFLIYLGLKVTNTEDISHMIDRAPILLAPILVLAVYFLSRQLTSNYAIPFIAAFLTTVSFQILIGIFAGFFANWIALITGYFCLGYFFKFLKEPRKPTLVIFSVLLIVTLFAHVYTWSIISLCAGIFLILQILLKRTEYSRKAVILLLIVIAISIVIDVSKSLATNSSSGVLRGMELSDVRMGSVEFAQHWDTLAFAVNFGLGGIMGNSIIILLGLYWILRSDYKEPATMFLLIFFSIAIIPLFIGDWIVQSRTLYMIPFQIPAAIGLYYIFSYKKRENRNANKGSAIAITVSGTLCGIAICAVLTAMAVFVLSNLYLIYPPR